MTRVKVDAREMRCAKEKSFFFEKSGGKEEVDLPFV